jgi:hypothetical protein
MGKTGDLLVQLLMLLCGVVVIVYLVNLISGMGKKDSPAGPSTSPSGIPDSAATAAGKTVGTTIGQAAGAGVVSTGTGAVTGGLSAGIDGVLDSFATVFGTSEQGFIDDFGTGLKTVGGWLGHPEWFDNGVSDQPPGSSISQYTLTADQVASFDPSNFALG